MSRKESPGASVADKAPATVGTGSADSPDAVPADEEASTKNGKHLQHTNSPAGVSVLEERPAAAMAAAIGRANKDGIEASSSLIAENGHRHEHTSWGACKTPVGTETHKPSSSIALASQTAAALLVAATETAAAAATGVDQQFPTAHSDTAAISEARQPGINDNISNRVCTPLAGMARFMASHADAANFTGSGTDAAYRPSLEVPEVMEEKKDDLPAFADEENVALHLKIKEKQRLLSQQETQTGLKAERVLLMRQHLQQLKAEAAQLESLAAAKESHINSDKHMEGVALRQTSKLKGEMQQQQQQQQQLQTRLTGVQLEIARGQEQIDCFKLKMKWNEEELAQWRSAAQQKEEDLSLIAEFKRKDDARAAGLITQTQKVSVVVAEARKRLREEEAAARAARAELQRSLEQFSEQQKARAVIIAQG